MPSKEFILTPALAFLYNHGIMRPFICLLVAFLMTPNIAAASMWALPDKVDGVLYVDNFGGCYFYNDIGLLYVTENQKAVIVPHLNKSVVVDVTGIYQVSVPGDIRMDKFTIENSAKENASRGNQIQLTSSWLLGKKGESLNINMKNLEARDVSVYPGIIDFFVLTKKESTSALQNFMDVSDGPSTVLGWQRIFGDPQRSWAGTYSRDQKRISWTVRDGKQIKDTVLLCPGASIDIPINLEHANGRYELVFGYKSLRDSSYETSMKINDIVLPVLSNRLLINSNYLQQLPWSFWILSAALVAFLSYRFFRYLARPSNRAEPAIS